MGEEAAMTITKFDDFQAFKPTDVLKIACSGLRLLSERKVNFDHHLCEKVIGYAEMPGDRPLRPSHVNYLIQTMMRGTFHPEWVRFIVCELGESVYRMNGQHTAMARLEMPKGWKEAGQIGMMVYRADSVDAMRELYASIDRGAPRTKSNILGSYLTGTEMFEDVSPTLVRILGEGLSFWLWESPTERGRHDADEVAWLLQNTYKNLVQVVTVFAQTEPRVVAQQFTRRAPVIAAMLETFGKVYQASCDFWTPVRTGVGFDSTDDPRLRLRNFLQESKMTVTDSKVRTKKVDRETMYRVCLGAFNSWRKGEPRKVLLSTKERQKAK